MYAPIYVVDAPKVDENEGSEVVEFCNEYITCALPDKIKYPEISKVQTLNHTTTCRK